MKTYQFVISIVLIILLMVLIWIILNPKDFYQRGITIIIESGFFYGSLNLLGRVIKNLGYKGKK